MFLHYFKYSIITTSRVKELVFWTFLFPIILATFMFAAFGKINKITEQLDPIPVVVIEKNENTEFKETVNSFLSYVELSEAEALTALEKGEIFGIIYIEDSIHLTVLENGFEQTIISTVLNQYQQWQSTIETILHENPSGLPAALETMNSEISSINELTSTNGTQDNLLNYFYAIFAMSCLFASFSGLGCITNLRANLSPLGARRCISPTHKWVIVTAEFLASLLLQFVIQCVTFLYMWLILRINFGDNILPIFPILILGSSAGIMLGMFIGALPKPSAFGFKIGLCISVSMLLSILADLCVSGIKNTIEHSIPILNRINPATLISDSFYALNVYDTYDRYWNNLAGLALFTIIFGVLTIFLIRRNRYASL